MSALRFLTTTLVLGLALAAAHAAERDAIASGAKLTKADAARTAPAVTTPSAPSGPPADASNGGPAASARGIEKKDIRRGMVIAKPGSATPHAKTADRMPAGVPELAAGAQVGAARLKKNRRHYDSITDASHETFREKPQPRKEKRMNTTRSPIYSALLAALLLGGALTASAAENAGGQPSSTPTHTVPAKPAPSNLTIKTKSSPPRAPVPESDGREERKVGVGEEICPPKCGPLGPSPTFPPAPQLSQKAAIDKNRPCQYDDKGRITNAPCRDASGQQWWPRGAPDR